MSESDDSIDRFALKFGKLPQDYNAGYQPFATPLLRGYSVNS